MHCIRLPAEAKDRRVDLTLLAPRCFFLCSLHNGARVGGGQYCCIARMLCNEEGQRPGVGHLQQAKDGKIEAGRVKSEGDERARTRTSGRTLTLVLSDVALEPTTCACRHTSREPSSRSHTVNIFAIDKSAYAHLVGPHTADIEGNASAKLRLSRYSRFER